MGNNIQLEPVPQPLAIFESMIAKNTTTLTVEEMGDNFNVSIGKTRKMDVYAKGISLHGRKKVYETGRSHMFDIVKEGRHLKPTFVLEDEKKKKYMEVKRAFACTSCLPLALLQHPTRFLPL